MSAKHITLIAASLVMLLGAAAKEPTAICDAARLGELEVVGMRSADGADVKGVGPSDGSTALHWAAYRGDLGVVAMLINRGAEVNARTKFGRTPLHWAAINGDS